MNRYCAWQTASVLPHCSRATPMPLPTSSFGYADNYRDLIMKRMLPPSSLSIVYVYVLPVEIVAERFNTLIINAVQLNLLSALVLFAGLAI